MSQALWRVSVAASPETEEAVTGFLGRILAQPVVSYTDAESGGVVVSAYCADKPVWSRPEQAAFGAELARIQRSDPNPPTARISVARMPRKNWAEAWKHHFHPIQVGAALLLKPSWSRRRPRPGQAVVVLNPGLSFGTGQHPTTNFCLRQLVAARGRGRARSVLDVGTGSGILAIAAVKLGYAPVIGLDNDPDAVRVARANARRNRVSERIRFRTLDLAGLSPSPRRGYSVVCANLLGSLLVREAPRLAAQVARDGRLLLAGVLRAEFPAVASAYEALGLRLVASRAEGEWRSAALARVGMERAEGFPETASRGRTGRRAGGRMNGARIF